jgi:uncharacterized damage-inducible protein DinB
MCWPADGNKIMKKIIQQFTDYNVWGNAQIMEFLAQHDRAVLDRETKSSFPTIRKTLFHIADAQYVWFERMNGISPSDWPSNSMLPDDVFASIEATSLKFAELVAGKDEHFLNADCKFKSLDGTEYSETNANIIMHCMNHTTFHRGQLITMFRTLNLKGKMPRTDLIAYLRMNGS